MTSSESQVQGPNLFLLSFDQTSKSTLLGSLERLKDEFENLQISGLDSNTIAGQLEINAEGVILDLGDWQKSDEKIVNGLRGSGFKGPVLVLAKRKLGETAPTTRAFDKVVFLDKPYDEKEMVGMVRRMILAPIIAARKHPRHDTNEQAEVQVEGTGGVHKCLVRNISKGGAYLEFERALNVRIGDVVVLKIRLGQVARVYALRARVAWINPGGSGFGIEFMVALGSQTGG